MEKPEPYEHIVCYNFYESIRYLEYKGHGNYEDLLYIAHDIKNSCGRDSTLVVDPECCVDETYYDGEELKLMQAFVKEFELTKLTKFLEY